MTALQKTINRKLRQRRVRAKVTGTEARPRLAVHISNRHINVQLIDDTKQRTIASSTTVGSALTGTTTEKAAQIGMDIAKKAKKAKVNAVVFDRHGRRYAGRMKALADAARSEGLEF